MVGTSGGSGGPVLAERAVRLATDLTAAAGLDTAIRLLDDALTSINASRDELAAVAVGLPAPVDLRTGLVGSSSILPAWVGVRAEDGRALRERLDLPVVVDNDSNLGALGEMTWGASVGRRDSAYIKASTGIGAGLVIAGELFRGRAGTAGEIGHTTIDENGPICRCGNRGCLEMLAGVPILLRLLEQAYGRPMTLPAAISRARAGGTLAARACWPTPAGTSGSPSPTSPTCSIRRSLWSAASSSRPATCCWIRCVRSFGAMPFPAPPPPPRWYRPRWASGPKPSAPSRWPWTRPNTSRTKAKPPPGFFRRVDDKNVKLAEGRRPGGGWR
ncbi:ROK family protein [Fodinicola feengrottensis]